MMIRKTSVIAFLVASLNVGALAKEASAPVAVQIDVVSASPALTVHLHFTNLTKHAVYLAKSQACANGDAQNVFTITSNGQKIRYTGALESAKAQFPADYIELAPKASYDVTTVITQYAFLPGKQPYQLQYVSEMWDKTEKQRSMLTSNSATATLDTPSK